MTKTTIKEYGGFVFNDNTDEYELLFVTQFSELLAKNRALEKAIELNRMGENYNEEDYFVKFRYVEVLTGEWEEFE